LVLLTSPFALYYAGELRPYAMQIAAGAVAAAAMRKVIEGRDDGGLSGLHATAGASLFLACSSLTGAVWSAGLWIGVLIIRTDWIWQMGFWKRVLPWMAGALVIASYYAWTLVNGYRAAAVGGGGLLSLGFGFYELLGLTGLGPSRSEIRANPQVVLRAMPILLPALMCICWAWFAGVCVWMKSATTRSVAGVACAVALPILVLAAVGVLMHFRVLGRHLSPVLPALLLPISINLASNGWKRLPAALAVAFGIASALGLRFMEKHAREDYRRATDIAIHALQEGKTVQWRADMNAARFHAYGRGGWPMIHFIQPLETDGPTSLMFADVVIVSRPDLSSKTADHRLELMRESFQMTDQFSGFEVWRNE
jgi:predicted outer membrane lipoprotein